MRVRIVAFATAGEALGAPERELTLEEGAVVADLRDRLLELHPDLERIWPRLAVAIDGELASSESPLVDGAEVALLPPVSGGSGTPAARLVEAPIDSDALIDQISDPSCGAVLLFLGTVRDNHQGRQVAKLTYHAYAVMAEKVLARLVDELKAGHEGLRVGIVHRVGEVPIGEASVAIAVASPHREVAYDTSRLALERLKREVPIWKRELYADGEVAWREEESLAPTSRRASARK